MTFIEILRLTHSSIRWLVVLVGLIIIAKGLIGWAMKSNYQAIDRKIMGAFMGIFGIQVTLGLIFFVVLLINGGYAFYQVIHIVFMFIAFFVAMRSARWKNGEDHIPYRNNAIALLISAVLIYAAVAGLPVGWSM